MEAETDEGAPEEEKRWNKKQKQTLSNAVNANVIENIKLCFSKYNFLVDQPISDPTETR